MVFNDSNYINTVFIALTIWILGLSVFLYRIWHHYNRLTQGVSKKNLQEILESLLSENNRLKNQVETLAKEIRRLDDDGKFHVQKVGLLRFNPFSDTGGSQSFTIAILDGKTNGIVLTSLYARTGNRWYVKEVREGKGKEIELSKEELSAITKASVIH